MCHINFVDTKHFFCWFGLVNFGKRTRFFYKKKNNIFGVHYKHFLSLLSNYVSTGMYRAMCLRQKTSINTKIRFEKKIKWNVKKYVYGKEEETHNLPVIIKRREKDFFLMRFRVSTYIRTHTYTRPRYKTAVNVGDWSDG